MLNPTTYLTPGLFITLEAKCQSLQFTQLGRHFCQGFLWRIALIDALNQGYVGDLADLPAVVSTRIGVDTDIGIPLARNFLQHLQNAGLITYRQPLGYFCQDVDVASGAVGPHPVAIATPVSLVSQDGHDLWFDHQGNTQLKLSMAEVLAAAMFSEPVTVAAAREAYLEQNNTHGLTGAQFDALVSRMAGAQLLFPAIAPRQVGDSISAGSVDASTLHRWADDSVSVHDEFMARIGRKLVPVIAVSGLNSVAPTPLGTLVAGAIEYEGGRLREKFDFVPMFFTDESRLAVRASTPSVFVFFNDGENVGANMAFSAAVKAINAASITVHSGPASASDSMDCDTFFAENAHVDVVVRGEGELVFAELLDAIDTATMRDLSALQHIPGLAYRTADGVQYTMAREVISDLKTMPSPYAVTYSDSWQDLHRLHDAYSLFDNYGLLRYVARFVRQETGMSELEFYDKITSEVLKNPQHWPIIAATLNTLKLYMAPPGSWGLFMAEARRYVVNFLGVSDDSALRTVLAVQHAHLPSPARNFPETIELEHDYDSWQACLLASQQDDQPEDSQDAIPRLSEFGPATLVVDDPHGICVRDIGLQKFVLDASSRSWELDSNVARPRSEAVVNFVVASDR